MTPSAADHSLPDANSVGEMLTLRAARSPDAPFICHGSAWLSYQQAEARAVAIASVLQQEGIGAGDRVAVCLANGWEFPIAWFALAKLGAVMVPMNPGGGPSDLGHVLRDSGAVAVVTKPSIVRAPHLLAALRVGLKRFLFDARSADDDANANTIDLLARMADPASAQAPSAAARDSLLNLQYTSGTTGEPKGCMLTHGYWLDLAARSADLTQASEFDVMYICQPYYYLDPQWMTLMTVRQGARLVVDDRFSASRFWKRINDEAITLAYCIGTMPLMLLKQPEDAALETRHRLRVMYCSGIVADLHAEFERRFGVRWREVYGTTETGVDLAMRVTDADSVGSGLLGRCVEGKEARIVGVDDRPLPDDEIGELVVRGRPLTLGYWNRPELSQQLIREGWLHTGDLAVRNSSGAYRLVGRLKDMIRRAGENISAAEVEAVVTAHPAVLQCAVTAVSDPVRGEEALAWVRLRDPRCDLSRCFEQLREFALKQVARFKVPRYWIAVAEFPMTASERIAKHQLGKLYPLADVLMWDSQHPTSRGAGAAWLS